jgi:cathepsin B
LDRHVADVALNKFHVENCRKIGTKKDVALLQEDVDRINSGNHGWHASLHEKFAHLDVHTAARQHLGLKRLTPAEIAQIPEAPTPTDLQIRSVPATYDHRSAMRANRVECTTWEAADQGTCGSCYAFAANRVFNERLCRMTSSSSNPQNIQLSEQDVVSCLKSGSFFAQSSGDKQHVTKMAGTWNEVDGCDGGSAVAVWLQMFTDGRVVRSLHPYTGKGRASDPCPAPGSRSKNVEYFTNSTSLYRIIQPTAIAAASLIQVEIQDNGPVSAAMQVYNDFMSYSGGVYRRTSSQMVGAHAVVLLGWGTEGGTEYWTFANSWGARWGEQGYGRIRKGVNEVDIESEIVMVTPSNDLPCSSTKCVNGYYDQDCKCVCRGFWSGAACDTCSASSIKCSNGGKPTTPTAEKPETCGCTCLSGFFGTTCQDFILVQWYSAADASTELIQTQQGAESGSATPILTAQLSWSLSDYKEGSSFARYTLQPVTNASDGADAVAGTTTALNGKSGGFRITLGPGTILPYKNQNLDKEVTPPKDTWIYALRISRGTNEFGGSRGFDTQELPALTYNSKDKCYEGGHQPAATSPIQQAGKVCKDAYSGDTHPAGTYPPVEIQATASPTKPALKPSDIKKKANQAISAVSDWTQQNVAGSAEKFGAAFPLVIKNAPKPPGISVANALRALFAGNVSQFDYIKCKGYLFKEPDEPICKLILGYYSYLPIGAILGVFILLVGIIYLSLRLCCGLGAKQTQEYGSMDKIVLGMFYIAFLILITVGAGAGFAVVHGAPSNIEIAFETINVTVTDINKIPDGTEKAIVLAGSETDRLGKNATGMLSSGVDLLTGSKGLSARISQFKSAIEGLDKNTASYKTLSAYIPQLDAALTSINSAPLNANALDGKFDGKAVEKQLNALAAPALGPLTKLSKEGESFSSKLTTAQADMNVYINYVLLATKSIFGFALLVMLISMFAMCCRSAYLTWVVFFMAIFWMSVAMVCVGVYLPTGKMLDDTCAVLPDRSDDGVPNVFVETALAPDMENRETMLNVVKECLETEKGQLMKVYNLTEASFSSQFPAPPTSNADVQKFLAVDFVTSLDAINAFLDKENTAIVAASISNQANNLRGLVRPPAANATDMRPGISLQNGLRALDKDVNDTMHIVTKQLVSAGSDCTFAGDDWDAVKKAVCNGVAGTIDITWFAFFLTTIAMFFWCIVIAKLTKRLAPHDDNDLRKPLVPRQGAAMKPYFA